MSNRKKPPDQLKSYANFTSGKEFLTQNYGTREEIIMPYVNIRITNEAVTPEKKAALISGVTDLLRDTLGKNPATTVVVIDELNTDNWGIGGETVTQIRKRG